MSDEMWREILRRREADEMAKTYAITDDTCHGRCEQYQTWFAWETRGLMGADEAHEVLDMLLNRLASDGLLTESEP